MLKDINNYNGNNYYSSGRGFLHLCGDGSGGNLNHAKGNVNINGSGYESNKHCRIGNGYGDEECNGNDYIFGIVEEY